MYVAVILLKVYNWFGLNTDIYILYKGSRKIGFFHPKNRPKLPRETDAE